MSCFLVKKIDSIISRFVKSTVKIENNVNSKKMSLILNQPVQSKMLWTRLVKKRKKYSSHFNEEDTVLKEAFLAGKDWFKAGKRFRLGFNIDPTSFEHHVMKKMARELSIKELVQKLIKISDNFPEIFRKCYFKSLAKS